jgi:hypothetical protein
MLSLGAPEVHQPGEDRYRGLARETSSSPSAAAERAATIKA